MDNFLSYFRKPVFTGIFYLRHPLKFAQQFQPKQQVQIHKKVKQEKVSIVILTYNAIDYVKLCLTSLEKTSYKDMEIIVVDNNSEPEVKKLLKEFKSKKLIDKLFLSKENTFFTGGNNIGVSLASVDSDYIVLLNSDIEIKNPNWLQILISNKPKRGIISFGKADIPVIRPDGWCFGIDKKTYLEFGGLNEYYKMDWGITELTGKVLRKGYEVKTIVNPNNYVYHFGQKSRPKKRSSQFKKMDFSEIFRLFENKKVSLLKV